MPKVEWSTPLASPATVAEKIYEGISKQSFVDFFGEGGLWEEHIAYNVTPEGKALMIQKIIELFKLDR